MENQIRCCCLKIQKAFLFIIYFDMSRIVWGLLICAFMFQKGSSLSLVITIADVICIVFQSSLALYINMRALPQNNNKPIYIYRKFKIIFICFNILDRLIVPIVNCTLIFSEVPHSDQQDARSHYCLLDVFVALIITAVIWNFIEYYLYTIVRIFITILMRADYRPLRPSTQNRHQYPIDTTNQAIVYEVIGIKPATRRGQLVANIDKIEMGSLKSQNDVQKLINQPLTQVQSFQVYGNRQELAEINLIT